MDFNFKNNITNSANSRSTAFDSGFVCFIVFIVFLILKLSDIVPWSWIVVCIPLFAYIGLEVLALILATILLLAFKQKLPKALNKTENNENDEWFKK